MTYSLLIGLHIVAVIAWMAGLLYLPRLFAYHTRAKAGSQMDETFKIMEAKLLSIIMRPAIIAVVALGGALAWYDATQLQWGWGFLLRPWMLTQAGRGCIPGLVAPFPHRRAQPDRRRNKSADRALLAGDQ